MAKTMTHPAARSLCDSWASCFLISTAVWRIDFHYLTMAPKLYSAESVINLRTEPVCYTATERPAGPLAERMHWGDVETEEVTLAMTHNALTAADTRWIGLKIYDVTTTNRDSLLPRSTWFTLTVVWHSSNAASWNKSPLHVVGESHKTPTGWQRGLNLTLTFDRLITATHTHTLIVLCCRKSVDFLRIASLSFGFWHFFGPATLWQCLSVYLSVIHLWVTRKRLKLPKYALTIPQSD